MKNNIIMWHEPDAEHRAAIQDALKCATLPIQEAMKWFEWEGEYLTCGPETLKNGKEHWRNLYFYLSGYGDACYQLLYQFERKQPTPIPSGP